MKFTMMGLMMGVHRVRCFFVALGWGTSDAGSRRSPPDIPRVVGRNMIRHDDSPSRMGHGAGTDR